MTRGDLARLMRTLLVANSDEPPDWINDEEPREISRTAKIAAICAGAFLIPFCFWAGWFELQRAFEGNWRGWVYAFEWPIFGMVGIWLLRRIIKGDLPELPKIDESRLRSRNKESDEDGVGPEV